MVTFALFVLAALAFSVLAGLIEIRWARQARRRLLEPTSPVLHPLSQHRFTWLRPSGSRRVLRHAGLFIGFLLVSYIAVALVKAVHGLLAHWLS